MSNGTYVDLNPFRYCGEYYDAESGLIYLRARYYNPELGRFINEDPHWNVVNMVYGDNPQKLNNKVVPSYAAIVQSSNLYPYCGNNPVNCYDSSGENYNKLLVLKIIYTCYEYYSSAEVRELHYSRNNYNNGIPDSKEKAIENGWERCPDDKAKCHQFTAENGEVYEKFISPDGHKEVIYDAEGNIVKEAEDVGTYNYYDYRSDPIGHALHDVVPWIIYGNSPKDTTTFDERLGAIIS